MTDLSIRSKAAASSPIDPHDVGPLSPGADIAPRSTALSNRITSVLSSSYADLDIRDALETLDARHVENTPAVRRRLRLDLQSEVIQCNGEVIDDFGKVAQQLKRIGAAVEQLNAMCNQMRATIVTANRETAPMLDEAKHLIEQKEQVEKKQKILEAFNAHFVFSEDQITLLTSSAEPIDDEFFRIMNRVKNIHHDSRILLGSEDQRLGLEVLEKSGRHLNAAFQKLYRWVQREFKILDLENPQLNLMLRRAIRLLAERQALFQACLDYFAESRERVLSDSFYTALTGQTSKSDTKAKTKPIELFAHDPLRYVGDMLAWLHSSAVSEREALEVLFIAEGDEIAKGIQAGIESGPWADEEGEREVKFDGIKALNDLVNRDLQAVVRQLRQRVEQVLQSHEDPALAYKVANLITFYRATFEKLLGTQSEVIQILDQLAETARNQFSINMRDHIAEARPELASAPEDLGPPDFLAGALALLSSLMKSYDTSLTDPTTRLSGFTPVLKEALNPFLDACSSIGQDLESPAEDIFTINYILATRRALEGYDFTAKQAAELSRILKEQETDLVEYQHLFFVSQSGLQPLVDALKAIDEDQAKRNPEDEKPPPDLRTVPAFAHEKLTAVSQQLDAFLPVALVDATSNLRRLRDAGMVQRITSEAAELFCEDFERIEAVMAAGDAAWERAVGPDEAEELEGMRMRDALPRTSDEIRVLLS